MSCDRCGDTGYVAVGRSCTCDARPFPPVPARPGIMRLLLRALRW
jgi:hypothetical protein